MSIIGCRPAPVQTMTTHELTVEIKGNIRKQLEGMTLSEMRRVVAQYCTCGRCIFFETLGGGRCLNAGISEFTTGEEFSPPDEFSCCNWIGREDHTEAT